MRIWFSCLKTWVDVSWVGACLSCFFQSQKKETNYKEGEFYVSRDVT